MRIVAPIPKKFPKILWGVKGRGTVYIGHIYTGHHGVRLQCFNDLYRHQHRAIEVARKKILLVWLYPTVREALVLHWSMFEFNVFSKSNFTWQNWVKFDFQSILQRCGPLSRKNAGLFGIFLKKYVFKSDVHLLLHCGGGGIGQHLCLAEKGQNNKHTNIAIYRLNQPRGRFSENSAYGRPLNLSACVDSSTDKK